MGFVDKLKDARDRRRHDRDAAEYERRVSSWLRECQRATELCLTARQPAATTTASPVELWAGERLLSWWTGADLIAPRNTTVKTWTGASYRIGSRTTVRAGSSTTQTTVDRPSPIDRGTLAITDQRVLLLGRTRSIDWQFRRLLGVTHDDSGTWTALHVSNRQRLHGVGYPRSHGEQVRFYLALALALYRGEGDDFCSTLEADTLSLLAAPPAPPAGVAVDGRVRRLLERPATDVITASSAIDAPKRVEPRLAAGFIRTPLPVVNTAVKLMGFRTAVIGPGAEADLTKVDQSMRSDDSPWAAVLGGDAALVAAALDAVPSATARFVSASNEVLEDLALDAIDRDHVVASESGHSRDPADVSKQLEADGYRCSPVALTAESGENEVAVLDVVAQVSRWIRERPQAVVLHGPVSALRAFRGATTAYDVVAYAAPEDDLRGLGLMDTEASAADGDRSEADALPSISSSPISVAGRLVPNPAEAVARYLVDHTGTVLNYDGVAGRVAMVDESVIRATRRPWMNSRISVDEGKWFIERGQSAPWNLVPVDAQLRDADATVVGGLYDDASTLWNHFASDAPNRVGVAKLSKVLHLMRPGMYPIIDSRLAASYDKAAKDAARDVGKRRPEFATFKRLQWEAIRRDIVGASEALVELRAAVEATDLGIPKQLVQSLSDVRLLDMLAWAAAGEPDDEIDDD